jgi:L-iditol 2-dehydrogenase
MLVAVYHSNTDIRMEERPRPTIGAGEVLVRVEASGVCGSDVMEWYRVPRAPQVLGHEITGTVEEAGAGVQGFQRGQRVFVTHHVPCGKCRRCQGGHPSTCETLRTTHFDPGGFSQYVRVPALQVARGMLQLPDDVSFEEGSFIEPLACAVQGQRFADITDGQTVLVLGSGLSGLLHLQLARARGAGAVFATDLHDYRLQAAVRLGADAAFHASEDVPARLRAANGGLLADRVVVCSAAPAALEQAFRSVEPGGQILCFAPPDPAQRSQLPLFDLWRNEVALVFSYAASGKDLSRALELIRSGQVAVKQMISHRLPLAQAPQAFALTAAAAESLKVILLPFPGGMAGRDGWVL